jgi:CheY-like chemotaxis protein
MNNERYTILLVEDNEADVYLLKNALAHAKVNCELTVLSNGEMAMQFFQRQGKYATSAMPDLAIMDATLPMHDAIDVLKVLRQSKDFAKLPVVITSSSVDPNELLKMEKLGVLRYIAKPSSLEDFLLIGLALKQILLENQDSATIAACSLNQMPVCSVVYRIDRLMCKLVAFRPFCLVVTDRDFLSALDRVVR